jgi:16S rRNA (cytosine1407-C5)-methyltransferase
VKREKSGSGPAAFHAFYRGIYGERWEGLAAAFGSPSRQVGLRVLAGGGYDLLPAGENRETPQDGVPEGAQTGLYYLDAASVAAAASLELPGSGEILDACAAPGGKSLVLAAAMSPECRLVCNELSADRRRRLKAVLDSSLPPEIRSRVYVLGADASSLCLRRPAAYSAILLDAPCSSERHVLADPAALAEWTASRPASLARRQWALLSSAWIMLAPGGSLLYSTCSINPAENDGVVARLVAKHKDELAILPPDFPGAEATEYGAIMLPDRAEGAGPLYACRIRKGVGPKAGGQTPEADGV